jgi:predicted nucleic acid-binding protein
MTDLDATVVVDASLLAALASGDARAEAVSKRFADWIAHGTPLHTTELAAYEVASGLCRLVIAGLFPENGVEAAWSALRTLPITWHPLSDVVPAVRIALTLRRQSAYDAAYLALAQDLGATVHTLDGKLVNNAAGAGFAVALVGATAP